MIDERVIDEILVIEGAFIDHKDDRGGPTKYGISLRWARNIGLDLDLDGDTDVDDIHLVDPRIARDLFLDHFLYINGIELLPDSIKYQAFDISINSGPSRAGQLVQKVVNGTKYAWIKEDGVIGPITLNKIRKLQGENVDLAGRLANERDLYYARICKSNPSQLTFLEGWLIRSQKWRTYPWNK